MNLFQKTSVPRKLNTREMWRLYQTLRLGLQGNSQEYLMDEIIQMLNHISVEEFRSALKQMYGDADFSLSPIELALLFTKGLKLNNLFSFSDFVKVFSGSSK